MTGKLSALIRKSNPGGDAKLESLLRLFESQVGPPRRGGPRGAACWLPAGWLPAAWAAAPSRPRTRS
jgi:hypothetical protein